MLEYYANLIQNGKKEVCEKKDGRQNQTEFNCLLEL